MPRLFALDYNFPQPIVDALSEFLVEAELERVDRIDPRLSDMDDWELLLSLHHHPRPWDGLITTDSSMLNQPKELSVLIQTRLTLVVAMASGDDPLKATGLVFAHLAGICKRTSPDKPQVWKLRAAERDADEPWDALKRVAEHQHRETTELWADCQLDAAGLAWDPLSQ